MTLENDLQEFSTGELQREVTRREKALHKKPLIKKPITLINFSQTIDLCSNSYNFASALDFNHSRHQVKGVLVFEEAMRACYGQDYWPWFNKKHNF